MFRRFTSRTPDSRASKKSSKAKTTRDPPTLYPSGSTSSHSSTTQNETQSHSEENLARENHTTAMRRTNYPRSFDHRSTVSSANTTTTTNEDRERLRMFLKGAMAGSQVAPPDHKQALMERVLKRSKTMDKKLPEIPQTTSSLASMQSKSNFSTERALTSARLTPQQTSNQSPAAPSSGRRLDRVDANPTAVDFRNRLRKVTSQQQMPQRPEESPAAQRAPSQSTSLLDVKTREMIQSRFRQRHAVVAGQLKITTQEDILMSDQEEK